MLRPSAETILQLIFVRNDLSDADLPVAKAMVRNSDQNVALKEADAIYQNITVNINRLARGIVMSMPIYPYYQSSRIQAIFFLR